MAEQNVPERGIGSFFIPINGEFFDAIQTGQLRTANGITTYFILQRQAVFETGIWWGDAARIVHGSGGILSSDQAQRALREICENGHAKSFHMRGSRREYAVALHGFAVRYGKFTGMFLDAFATTNPRNPVYVKPSEPLSRPIPCGIAGPVEEWVPSECDGADKPVSRTGAAEGGIRRTSATEDAEMASSVARQSQLSRSSVAPVRRNTPDTPDVPEGPEEEKKQNHVERQNALGRVWTYYLDKMAKNPNLLTFTDLRRRKANSRLDESLIKTGSNLEKAEQLMKLAIDALAASTFHMGQNDRKRRYDSWENNLFKTAEQYEQWLEVA